MLNYAGLPRTAGPVTIVRADGTVEVRPPYGARELARVIAGGRSVVVGESRSSMREPGAVGRHCPCGAPLPPQATARRRFCRQECPSYRQQRRSRSVDDPQTHPIEHGDAAA